MPSNGKLGSKITWAVDDEFNENLIDGKLINNGNDDVELTLYATFSYGNYTSEIQTYNVSISIDKTASEVDIYYESIMSTSGEALKKELRTLITSTHTKKTTYENCKTYLQEADQDPNNASNMLLFYTGISVKKTDSMNVWNREHVWCQSLGWFSESGAGADLHHIRPCDPSLNSGRGNKKFGIGKLYFTPNDEYKGDVARIIFYLMTRYTEADNAQYSVTCIAESMEMLLEWNRIDPVSDTEIIRNNYIYTIQGNRNPFIDNANYANAIWG